MENGIAVAEYPRTFVLPYSGHQATVQRRFKGHDMLMAGRLVGNDADPALRSFAMLAQVVLLDGQPVLMEDFNEWDLDDLNAVFAEVGLGTGKNASLTAPVSLPLSNGVSRPQN